VVNLLKERWLTKRWPAENRLEKNRRMETLSSEHDWLAFKERARNNFPILHLIFSPSWPVLQSQKLEIEWLFLRLYSIRTNQYRLNLSAKSGSYYVHAPNVLNK